MTRTTNARIAGVTFLIYIAAGITSMVLFAGATTGDGIAAQLASIGRHATDLRLTILLNLVMNLCALVLAVTLYAITREQDRDLALLAGTCLVAEGIAGMDVSGRSACSGSRREPAGPRSTRAQDRRSARSC